MPAVNLVNVAPSEPIVTGETAADVYLHQRQGNAVDGQPVHDGKPIPRDPTLTKPRHDLGPRLTFFRVGDHGAVYDPQAGAMVERALSAADQARAIVHDWAIHSDCAVPAFVLPASDDPADKALAEAVLARFITKQPDEAAAEQYGKAFQITGRGDKADAAYAYKARAAALTPKLWVPGQEAFEVCAADVLLLLAAEQAQDWEAMLAAISGPTALVVNAGLDSALSIIDTLYMGISANTTDPVGSDTSLTGELTNASSGLKPVAGTYAHSNGTTTATQSATFTANSYDASNSIVPVTIGSMCLRTASGGGGTMRVREKLSSTATLSASGDALTVTYTLNGSAS